MPEIKQNFFGNAKPATDAEMLQVAFVNDPRVRRAYGQWLYDNFQDLVAEYKRHGRFLTLAEIEENPLQ